MAQKKCCKMTTCNRKENMRNHMIDQCSNWSLGEREKKMHFAHKELNFDETCVNFLPGFFFVLIFPFVALWLEWEFKVPQSVCGIDAKK